jgi:cytochrome c2
MRLPQGIVAAGITPKQALELGLSVDSDALDATTRAALTAEISASGTGGPMLNDPNLLIKLLNANAIPGLVVKDSNGDGTLDISAGDKMGVSCASCHSITDNSLLAVSNGGGIGKRLDGPAPHSLQVGRLFALASNSRAYFPLLQLRLAANNNKSIGRAPDSAAITDTSTEADVDAYLNNLAYYPTGMFDDAPDGNGAPMHIAPMFRTLNNAPFGTPGDIARLDNFANLVYTALLDPTTLVLPDGRNFLKALGGADAGDEIADKYLAVLTATGVMGPTGTTPGTGFPFVQGSTTFAVAGTEDAPVGVRVDNQKLIDMNAYTDSLPAPAPPSGLDGTMVAAGLELFRTHCTSCHNVDQSKPVPSFIVPLTPGGPIFPGYAPVVLALRPVQLPFRPMAFDPIQDDPNTIFDDKLVIVDASRRGAVRGLALPVLLDLARKPNFLHDNSVSSLDSLMDPGRGAQSPHPFFFADSGDRANVVEFLKSLAAP